MTSGFFRKGGSQPAISVVLLALIGLAGAPLAHAQSTTVTSSCLQEASLGPQTANTLEMDFTNPIGMNSTDTTDNTVVVMVAYSNKHNRNSLSVTSGSGTWTKGYAPKLIKKIGFAFFYGTGLTGQTAVTISAPFSDTLVAFAQEWQDLSIIEDKKAHKHTGGTSSSPTIKLKTKNPNDVIFNVVVYNDAANASPPTQPFAFFGTAGNAAKPFLVGGYLQTTAKGTYTDAFILNTPSTTKVYAPLSVPWASFATALETSPGPNQLFSAVPLTDFAGQPNYLAQPGFAGFPGFLYNGSNDLTVASPPHDADGRAIAAGLQPLDAAGNPDPVNGKIVFLGMGPSNYNEELCTGSDIAPNPVTGSGPYPPCDPSTFIDQVTQLQANPPSPAINPKLVVVDCAKGGQFIGDWLPTTATVAWTTCLQTRLQPNVYNVTPAQVQVLTFMDDDIGATVTLGIPNLVTSCPPAPVSGPYPATADACFFEFNLGNLMRLVKQAFPNLKMVFLQGRTYVGYAAKEPVAYENGFAVKWLIQAQIDQMANGTSDPVAGDLGYLNATSADNSTAWIGWGAYTWGAGAVPRADGQVWPGNNFAFDGIHTSQCLFYGIDCGRQHVADLMMDFYDPQLQNSSTPPNPYTAPWFLAPPLT